MKRSVQIVSVLFFILFSFYYTDKAVDIIRNNNPLMQEIKANATQYNVASVNAHIDSNAIIPGYNGLTINLIESFDKMKAYGFFDEKLLVYEEVVPSITINTNYDKYIVQGNELKDSVGIIFIVNDNDDITSVINILKNKNAVATFFVSNNYLSDNLDVVYNLAMNDYEIELLGPYDSNIYDNARSTLSKLINKKSLFCYTEYQDENILNTCKKLGFHTIIPTINASNYPYSTIKNNLRSGSIIALPVNDLILKELGPIISYIKQKGFVTFTLEELLGEQRNYENSLK